SVLVDRVLQNLLALPEGPESRVFEAARYMMLGGGGKRFRAFLCCEAAALFGVKPQNAARTAAAIECVHTYSLIHDDLPCMDDDDMRRGRPSLHKAFDEATAILAGDSLLSLAFEILADEKTHPRKAVRLDLIAGLAKASGGQGMVGGQMFDLLSADMASNAGNLTRLQKMKTGALISFAVDAGALLGMADSAARNSLAAYAHDAGLAFQIADDLLDMQEDANIRKDTGITDKTDKGADEDEVQRVTFVSLLGEARARAQAHILAEQAAGYLAPFGSAATHLRQAVAFAVNRDY
ncbi:MAG: polyprenyl synthetase family protein, partial [Alphaproteobacteria bacterium]|nr:polyprenyl synthetase family protein [Alphaproteobacteria bacterium]